MAMHFHRCSGEVFNFIYWWVLFFVFRFFRAMIHFFFAVSKVSPIQRRTSTEFSFSFMELGST